MSPMGAYYEELCILGLAINATLATATDLALAAYQDIRAYSRIVAIGVCDALPFGSTLMVEINEAPDAAGTGGAQVVVNNVYNGNLVQDVAGIVEVFEDQLTQGDFFANFAIQQDSGGPLAVCGILLGGFPREKPCEGWEPGVTTTTTTTAAP